MTRKHLLLTVALALLATILVAAIGRAEEKANTATDPQPVAADGWRQRNDAFNQRAAQGDVDLIFIGDSITQGWEDAGKSAWQKYYADRKAMNLGISGDRTQNVLWRLDHGNLDGIKPKLAVVMIGTNNSNREDNTAEEIGAGIRAIVKKLRKTLPETKVLVLAIFPRGEQPTSQREKNAKASQIAAQLADDKMVYFLDIGSHFLTADGTLPAEIMPDYLHLSPKGYEIWASTVEPKVAELMGDNKLK